MSRTFVGQKFNLPGVGDVTVNGFEKFTNTPGYGLVTDKGTYLYYDQDYVNKGAVFDGNQYYTPQLLEYLKNGQVAGIDLSQFDDDPTTTNSGRAIGQSGYIFTNPEAYNLYPTTFGVGNGIGNFTGIAKDANGNLKYVGYTGDGKNGSYTYEGTNGIQTDSWSRSGSSFLGKLFGGVGENIASSVRDVLGNPIVQLGTSIFNPAAAAGIQFGTAVGSGAPIGDALKDAAKSYAIGQAAGAVGDAVSGAVGGGAAGNIAGNAASGGASAALSGGNVLRGLLSGGAFGGINEAYKGILGGTVGGIDDSNNDLGKSMALQDKYYATGYKPKGTGANPIPESITNLLVGGLLGGGAIAAGKGLLSSRPAMSAPQQPQAPVTRPLDQFQINPQVNKYAGDFETFGERGSQGFRFYNAPVTGLLG